MTIARREDNSVGEKSTYKCRSVFGMSETHLSVGGRHFVVVPGKANERVIRKTVAM